MRCMNLNLAFNTVCATLSFVVVGGKWFMIEHTNNNNNHDKNKHKTQNEKLNLIYCI